MEAKVAQQKEQEEAERKAAEEREKALGLAEKKAREEAARLAKIAQDKIDKANAEKKAKEEVERLAKAASDLNEAEQSTVEAAYKTTGDEIHEYAAETKVDHYATKAYNDLTDHIEFKTIEQVDNEKQKLQRTMQKIC